MDQEDDRVKAEGGEALRCVVLDMGGKKFLLSICNIITSFYLLYSISKYLQS
jgi:hypothetical protein